jgi:hypothetical protein
MRMASSDTERLKEVIIYTLIIVVAATTRAYGIWEWSLVGDEIFTIKYADERLTWLIGPAHYALVVLAGNVFGLTEWSVRLPTVILGIVSIPTFYFLCRRTFDRTTALVGTALLLFSDWHLLFSQYARYYGGVFLFGTVAYFTYVEALRSDGNVLLVVSLFSCAFGFLFHPTFLVVPLSCAVASALVWGWPKENGTEFAGRIGKIYLLVSIAAGLIVLPWSVEFIQGWTASHSSAGPGGAFQIGALVGSLLDLANRIEIVLSVSAFFGFYFLLKHNLRLGVVFGILAGVPVLAYVLATELAPPFRPRYIFAFFPLVITFAGFTGSKAIRAFPEYGFARYAVLAIIVAGMLPGFVSYYTGKQSLDPSDAVRVLEKEYRNGDKVLAMPIGVHYKIGQVHPDWELLDRGDEWRDRVQRAVGEKGRVWIVAPSSAIPGVGEARKSWLIDHASLVWRRHAFGYERSMGGMSVWRVDQIGSEGRASEAHLHNRGLWTDCKGGSMIGSIEAACVRMGKSCESGVELNRHLQALRAL